MSIPDNSNTTTLWHTHTHLHATWVPLLQTRKHTQRLPQQHTVHLLSNISSLRIWLWMSQMSNCEVTFHSADNQGHILGVWAKKGFMVHSEARKAFPPVILVRLLKALWKWCGLSVKEVNAEIETLDHRRKHNTAFILPTAVRAFRTSPSQQIKPLNLVLYTHKTVEDK